MISTHFSPRVDARTARINNGLNNKISVESCVQPVAGVAALGANVEAQMNYDDAFVVDQRGVDRTKGRSAANATGQASERNLNNAERATRRQRSTAACTMREEQRECTNRQTMQNEQS
jgi:hypothetical protein